MSGLLSPVNLLVEGRTDEAVVRRILDHMGIPAGRTYGKNGKDALLQRLSKYNQAAQFNPWLVVVDLDQDAQCAPAYLNHHIAQRLPQLAPRMYLRVAVRAIESWLLADAEQIAQFLGVRVQLVPVNPDTEEDPKRTLVNLARRSRYRTIRQDLVPRPGSGASVGPDYVGRLLGFTMQRWHPDIAAQHSNSLHRCIEALRTIFM